MNIIDRKINLIFLVLLNGYAVFSVLYLDASMFFIIYLFWFDEVIRSVSNYIQIKMYKEDTRIPPQFTKYQALNNVKSQFLFLFIYAVFIIIVFGIFFFINSKDDVVTNIRIFVFHNLSFNVCIMISLIREFFKIRARYVDRLSSIRAFNAMNGHMATLHLSVIFGGLAWAITAVGFEGYRLDLGEYNKYAVAIPFFVIKFLVDLHEINHADEHKKNVLENLH